MPAFGFKNNLSISLKMNIFQCINWYGLIQSIAGIWVAIIATIALTSWKSQIKANRHVEFIDNLTDTVHSYIISMQGPITHLELARIGIEAHGKYHNQPEHIKNPGAVAYIKKYGDSTGEDIRKSLDEIKPILSKIKSLAAKGQIFRIKNYSDCQNACNMLEWSFSQIMAFNSIIQSQHLNWENPVVQESLNKILAIDPDSIRSNLTTQNEIFLGFMRKAYDNILK